jgi:tetrahydromethanopterin S-methyltransferase subunit C
MSDKVYEVADLESLAEAIRDDVFTVEDVGTPHPSIGMDGYVTVGQVAAMVRESGKEYDGRLFVTAAIIDTVRHAVIDAIASRALARLAADDVIDVFWNDDANDFAFALKEEEENDD